MNTKCENVTSSVTKLLTLVISSRVDMQLLERSFPDRLRCEVDSVVSLVKVLDGILAAMDNSVIPRVELAIKSVNPSSVRDLGSLVVDPDRNFSQIM